MPIWNPSGSGSGGISTIPIGNTLFVDQSKGSDATGAPYKFEKPYKTQTAAVAAAAAGDLIYMRPGAYTDATITTTKPLNLHYENGAVWNTGDDNISCIRDSGGAQTINISGSGSFYGGDSNNDGTGKGTFFIGNAGTKLTVHGKNCEGVGGEAGNSSFTFERLGVSSDGNDTQWPAIWWKAGQMHINCPIIRNGGGDYPTFSFYGGSGLSTDNLYVTGHVVQNGSDGGLFAGDGSGLGSARVWLNIAFHDNVGADSGPASIAATFGSGFYYFVGLAKFRGSITSAANELWMLGMEKMNGTLTVTGGRCDFDGEFDDTGIGGSALLNISAGILNANPGSCILGSAGTSLFNQSGGMLQISGGDFVAIAGQAGSALSGGTCRIASRIDMSAVAAANPIALTVGGAPILILESGCKLLTDGTAKAVVRDAGSITIDSLASGNAGLGTGVTVRTGGSFAVIPGGL